MSYCTDLFCWLHFPSKTYTSKYLVEEDLKSSKKILESLKTELTALVFMTEPKKFMHIPENNIDYEGMGIMNIIQNRINELLSSITEYTEEILLLEILLENWDNCHISDGRAIAAPSNIKFDSAYLEGDWIESVREDECD